MLRELLAPPVPIGTVLKFARLNLGAEDSDIERAIWHLLEFLAAAATPQASSSQFTLLSERLLRLLARGLRHGCREAGLTVDAQGWAEIDSVLGFLNQFRLQIGLWQPVPIDWRSTFARASPACGLNRTNTKTPSLPWLSFAARKIGGWQPGT
jgi:hypothetical protein